MTPESQLKSDINDLLDEVVRYPEFYIRMQSGVIRKGSRFIHLCEEGTADIQVFLNNCTIWLELKHPKGATSAKRKAAQAAFAEKVRALGHFYWRCESLEDVEIALGRISRKV